MPLFPQPSLQPLAESTDFHGKVALITGGYSGIAFEAGKKFLQHGLSTLIIAVRTVARGEEARQLLLGNPIVQAKNPRAVVNVIELDLQSETSVLAFVAAVQRETETLDILILSAAVGVMRWTTSSETGRETEFQVNYVSNMIISVLLLPLLVKSSKPGDPSHLTILSSRGHNSHSLTKNRIALGASVFEHFTDEIKYTSSTRYGESKLLGAMFVRRLATQLDSSKVIANYICPGIVSTDMYKTLPPAMVVFMRALLFFTARPMHDAVSTYTHAATASAETHGKFLMNNVVTEKWVLYCETPEGVATSEALWKESLGLVEKLVPGASSRDAGICA